MLSETHMTIVEHYEKCFLQHGANHKGVDWPNSADVETRYRVICEALSQHDIKSVLDFGSGVGGLYEYMMNNDLKQVDYSGLELSSEMVSYCRKKFTNVDFYDCDVLKVGWKMPSFDAVVMNGVFTEKLTLTHDQMFQIFKKILNVVYQHTNCLMIFNVMSKQVDWERDDLFHVSLDDLAWLIKQQFSRKFIIRNDYGLFEYMVLVYK